jgi:antitoxin component YwqK of YwqJK toxin-antitoxin module
MQTKEQEINQYNSQGQRHGYWEEYFNNGLLYTKGNYQNGQQHGYCKYYNSYGRLTYKTFYF